MKFHNSELETTFEIAEPLKVRDRLLYDGVIEWSGGQDTYLRLWKGVIAIAKNWESPVGLSLDALDQEENPEVIRVIKWAGTVLFAYMFEMEQTPKN